MTRYEQGFLTKCAEHGLDYSTAMFLLKSSGAPLNLGPVQSTDDVIDPGKVSEAARFVTVAKDPNSGLNRAAFGAARLLKALNGMPESVWERRRREKAEQAARAAVEDRSREPVRPNEPAVADSVPDAGHRPAGQSGLATTGAAVSSPPPSPPTPPPSV